MKLLNNYLSVMALAATSEAVIVGMKHGLAPATIIEVINAGSGRTGASLDKFPRAILPGTFDSSFTTDLMCKDLGLFLEEAETVGVKSYSPMRLAIFGTKADSCWVRHPTTLASFSR